MPILSQINPVHTTPPHPISLIIIIIIISSSSSSSDSINNFDFPLRYLRDSKFRV
jgi:hypothetical protein